MRTGSACEHPSPSVLQFLGASLAEKETGVDPLKSVLGGFGSPTLSAGSLDLGLILEKSLS